MHKPWLRAFLVLLILATVGTFIYFAWRAHRGLVTLNVRNMEVRKVVGKIEWQTWEKIFVGKEVSGKVTLNVHKMPLDDVLEIIGEQTSSRWMTIYPLYTSGKSLTKLEKSLRGEISASDNGWKALRSRSFGMGGPGGMFGMTARDQNKLVTLNINMKDLEIATMALSRYSRAQIVPEDGTHDLVSLKLANAAVSDGVKQLARQTQRKWTKLYAIESFRRGGPRGPRDGGDQLASNNRGSFTNENGFDPGRGGRGFSFTNEDFQRRLEAQLEIMTPQERAQFEERQKQFQEMRNLSPEERQKRFQEMAARPEFQQRVQNRMMSAIKNTTPEQRVERDIRRNQRAARQGR